MIISDFKAKCIAALKEVNTSGEPVTVTLRGKPVAVVSPPPANGEKGVKLGTFERSMTIEKGIENIDFSDDCEMLK